MPIGTLEVAAWLRASSPRAREPVGAIAHHSNGRGSSAVGRTGPGPDEELAALCGRIPHPSRRAGLRQAGAGGRAPVPAGAPHHRRERSRSRPAGRRARVAWSCRCADRDGRARRGERARRPRAPPGRARGRRCACGARPARARAFRERRRQHATGADPASRRARSVRARGRSARPGLGDAPAERDVGVGGLRSRARGSARAPTGCSRAPGIASAARSLPTTSRSSCRCRAARSSTGGTTRRAG